MFEDRTFTFVLKTPPTPVLLRQAAGLEKGSTTPGKAVVGTVTEAQIEEIAKIKMPDLNAYDLEAAKQQVRGTARSMGLRSLIELDVRSPRSTPTGTTSPGGHDHTREPSWRKARSTPTRRSASTATSCSPRPRRSSW